MYFFFFFSEENQSKKFLSRVPLHLFGHNWIICHFLKQYLQEISFYQLWFTTLDRSLESLLTKDRVVQRKVYIWTKLGHGSDSPRTGYGKEKVTQCRLSMPLSRMKPVRCETSGGRKASPQVVWWLRHGASNSTRSKERNGEVGGSYIKPSLLYLSLKHCRPNTNYGGGCW